MHIVYLDQNMWIYLSQVAHKKDPPRGAVRAHEFLVEAKRLGQVKLPLSIVHYMETLRRGDDASRGRLGDFMWSLSSGVTIAPSSAFLKHELDVALDGLLPGRVDPSKIEPLHMLGEGMSHARGEPISRIFVPEELERVLGRKGANDVEQQMNDLLERSLLGAGPFAEAASVPRPDLKEVEQIFVDNMLHVRRVLGELPQKYLRRGVYYMSVTDIAQALKEALKRHKIEQSELDFLDWNGVYQLIDSLPTQRVANHLLYEWARNQELKLKRNDLYDWMGLIPAIAYCDVVVTENLTADLVNRGSLEKRATVMTNLGELPDTLVELSL